MIPYEFSIDLLISDLSTALDNTLETIDKLDAQISELKSAGVTDAALYMRSGRYAYLIHPTAEDGTRLREYIGSDPAKIANSKTAIDRYKTLCKLIDARDIRQRTLAYVIASIKTSIHSLAGAL